MQISRSVNLIVKQWQETQFDKLVVKFSEYWYAYINVQSKSPVYAGLIWMKADVFVCESVFFMFNNVKEYCSI